MTRDISMFVAVSGFWWHVALLSTSSLAFMPQYDVDPAIRKSGSATIQAVERQHALQQSNAVVSTAARKSKAFFISSSLLAKRDEPSEEEAEDPTSSDAYSRRNPSSFGPFPASWKSADSPIAKNSTYLGSLKGSSSGGANKAANQIDENENVASPLEQQQHQQPLMRSEGPVKASSFAPNQAAWKLRTPAVNNSYVGSLASGKTPPSSDQKEEPVMKPPLMKSSAPAKASSFSPNQASWKLRVPAVNTSYVASLSSSHGKAHSASLTDSPFKEEPAQPVPLMESSAPVKASSFAPNQASWKVRAPAVNTSYVGSLSSHGKAMSASTDSATLEDEPDAAAAAAAAVDPLVESSAPVKASSFAPNMAGWKVRGPKFNSTYLGRLTGGQNKTLEERPSSSAADVVVNPASEESSPAAASSTTPPVTYEATPSAAKSTIADDKASSSYAPNKASWKSAPPKVNTTYIGSLAGKLKMESSHSSYPQASTGSGSPVPEISSPAESTPSVSESIAPPARTTSSSLKTSSSYAPNKASWKSAPPKKNNTYIGSLAGNLKMETPSHPEAQSSSPPPQVSPQKSSSTPEVEASAAPIVHQTIRTSKASSYAPSKASWKSTELKVNNTYIGSLAGKSKTETLSYPKAHAAPAPVQGSPETSDAPSTSPVSTQAVPMTQKTTPVKGGSYSPNKASWKSTEPKVNNTYIGSLAGKSKAETPSYPEAHAAPAPVQVTPETSDAPSTPPVSTQAVPMTQKATTVKGGSYSPNKASWKSAEPKVNNTYIGSLAGKSKTEAPPSYPKEPSAPATVQPSPAASSIPVSPPSVAATVQKTTAVKGGSYSPNKASWKTAAPKVNNTYIGSLAGSLTRESLSYPEAAPAPVQPSTASSTIPISSPVPSPVTTMTQSTLPGRKRKSYIPNKDSWKSAALKYNNSYIGSLAGSLSMETHSYPTAPKTQTWNAPAPAPQPPKPASSAPVQVFVTPPSYAPSRKSLKTKVGASTMINTGSVIVEGGIGKASESFSYGSSGPSKAADQSSSYDEGLFGMRAKAFRDAKVRAHASSEKILNLPVPRERASNEDQFFKGTKAPLKVNIGSRQAPPRTVPVGRILGRTAPTASVAASPGQRAVQ